MTEKRQKFEQPHLDPRELNLPETTYSRDIENNVFRGIIVKILSTISGIGLLEGSFLDSVIGRLEKVKGISTEQDPKTHSIKIKLEVRVRYGTNIPQKAEEIQSAVVEEITKMTGVRVSEIHVVFKELLGNNENAPDPSMPPNEVCESIPEECEDEF